MMTCCTVGDLHIEARLHIIEMAQNAVLDSVIQGRKACKSCWRFGAFLLPRI